MDEFFDRPVERTTRSEAVSDAVLEANAFRTAISRKTPSKPAQVLFPVIDRLVSRHRGLHGKDRTLEDVVDYGCGHGVDVLYFRSRGLRAAGFEPYPPYGWSKPLQEHSARVVVSTYVLNVIPTAAGRKKVLESMMRIAAPGGFLIVSTRSEKAVQKEAVRNRWTRYGDGFISHPAKSTFQHGFTVREIANLGKSLGLVPIRMQPDLGRYDASCVVFRIPDPAD